MTSHAEAAPHPLLPATSVTTIHVEPRFTSRREQLLQGVKKVENIHIEEELNYHDKDHSRAHGHWREPEESKDKSELIRNRTLSIRRRRGSHDEKLVGKSRKFLIDVEETQRLILAQEDTDGDFQITVQDSGPKTFQLGTANSSGYRKYEIRGTYMLSNLLQELALAADYGRKFIVLDEERLNENPLDRLSRLIKYHFWDGLTRRIDAEGLEVICNDPKNRSHDQRPRVYVPYHDQLAMDYYTDVAKTRPHLNLDIVRLPEIITPRYVKSLNQHPGILSLGLRKSTDPRTKKPVIRGTPFVVPGGRFNEMYGWDSYFEALGLLVDGRIELARGMVENFNYEIEHYGKILNANRSYYLTRSQPPFLTDMIHQVGLKLPEKAWKPTELKAWHAQGYRASIKELLSVWMAAPRLDAKTGLCKFHPEGIGMPPETEASHFTHILEPYAHKMGIPLEDYMRMYDEDEIQEPELDQYFVHDRAVRESGHDTTYRYEKRCANLATIDLNSLVYKYDVDLERVGYPVYLVDDTHFTVYFFPSFFAELGERMKERINKYLWNPVDKLYYDYDCAVQEMSVYETVTCLWALWAGIATQEQANAMVPRALELFEVTGGLVSGTEVSRGLISLDRPNRQWDYPYGWAPHQILAWPGLVKYGFVEDARRVAYRWMYTITKSFVDFNGVVPEKFDVVDMTHKVEVEYGNVGADFRFVVREGFGWMNASFQLGLTHLTKGMKRALGALTPPEQLFIKNGQKAHIFPDLPVQSGSSNPNSA
ncbi:trehalase-domain-containing protein [Fimicolochytrium jonesii]|uniref:trehalase-domain-containing protein n=1 Tax=Fimicolochytrium jonesii TaxID=1396493 RepID=UPI0022FEAAA5|nr:trehalase-domain-containing protein [Fimicolochytrium jonesii]KAI8823411.1 trehalase-domain-containing protein [Fimicolochytrium jonesii]